MIRNIVLKNWRAYDELSLALGEGTTFVVARNGVGKTSLVQAVAFALYGRAALPDASTAIRAGSQSARVEATVDLADGRTLRIVRTVEPRRSRFEGWVGDESVPDEDALAELLAKEWGAEPDFLARSTIVQEGAIHSETESSFSLYQHLSNVYGVTNLLVARDELERLRKATEKSLRGVKQAVAASNRELDPLRERVETTRTDLGEAEVRLQEAKGAFTEAQRVVERAEARRGWGEQVAERLRLLGELVSDVEASTGTRTSANELPSKLDDLEARAQREVDDIRRRKANAEGRIEAIQSSLQLLTESTGVCPVCRRPLAHMDVESAHAQHQAEIAEIQRESAQLEEQRPLQVLDVIRDARRRLSAIPPERPEPAAVEGDPSRAFDARRKELESSQQEVVLRKGELEGLREQLAAAELESARSAELEGVFRREALVTAASEAMRAAAERVIHESIQPLAEEVAWRWKRLVGERGVLSLRPDGTVVLHRGEHEVHFHDFSAGERMMAVLLVRMTVLATSTGAGFFWVDEPLEHLDPTSRLGVASMLAQASMSHGFGQVVVTTYEERIAEQIARFSDQATVQLVTAAAGS